MNDSRPLIGIGRVSDSNNNHQATNINVCHSAIYFCFSVVYVYLFYIKQESMLIQRN